MVCCTIIYYVKVNSTSVHSKLYLRIVMQSIVQLFGFKRNFIIIYQIFIKIKFRELIKRHN